MRQSQYIKSRNDLIRCFSEELKIREDEMINGQFNLVSAGLMNYLPSLSMEKHEDIFRNILVHKKLSILEQSEYEALEYAEMEGLTDEILPLLKSKPVIICSFHTGSYRLINLLLTKSKVPYSLVIGKDVAQKEAAVFTSLFNRLSAGNVTGNFGIIDAEDPNSGLKMLRALKEKRSLLLYIDGNTGAGTATTKNDNRCVINFLHQQLFARKGIAFLAYTADVPILTVASYRKSWSEIRLKFFEPIYPYGNNRSQFAEETTQKIYNLIAPVITEYPEQWEAWLYIHKSAHIINRNIQPQPVMHPGHSTGKIMFNTMQFGILKINGIPYLLRKSTYTFYQVDNQLYDHLAAAELSPISVNCLGKQQFNQLYEQGVVLYR